MWGVGDEGLRLVHTEEKAHKGAVLAVACGGGLLYSGGADGKIRVGFGRQGGERERQKRWGG